MKTYHLPIALAFIASHSFASPPETTKTNSVQLDIMHASVADRHESLNANARSDEFWKRMNQEFELQANRDAANRFFLPAAQLHWQSEFSSGYQANDAWAHAGRNLFLESSRRTAREVLGSTLPLEDWKNGARGLFRRLIRIDDTAQNDVHYAQAAPTAGEIDYIEDRSTRLDYGLDPLDGQLFGKAYLGHSGKDSLMGDQPLAIVSARYDIDPTSAGKLNGGIFVPLPYSWRISATASADPSKLDSIGSRDCTSWAFRLERINSDPREFRLLYVGFQSSNMLIEDNGRHNKAPMVAGGLKMPWPGGFWRHW